MRRMAVKYIARRSLGDWLYKFGLEIRRESLKNLFGMEFEDYLKAKPPIKGA